MNNINDSVATGYKKLLDITKSLKYIFIYLLDKLVNGFTIKDKNTGVNTPFKYYRYFISILIIVILGLFYYLSQKQDIFAIRNTKYEIILSIVLLGFSIYCFLFFAYRNDIEWSSGDTYGDNKRNFVKISNGNLSIDKSNLRNTLTNPLLKMMKYILLLLLMIVTPLLVINYVLHLHKKNNSFFNISYGIVGVLLVLIVLAIIAKAFSINATNSGNSANFCIAPKKNSPIFAYFQYALCIIKNIVFFIPCLLVILIDEINKDIKLTPSSIYILFFILLILVLVLFVLPIVFKYIRSFKKNDLLQGEGPFYLNVERTLGKYQNLNKNLSKTITLPNISEDRANANINSNPIVNKVDNLLNAFKIDTTNLDIASISSINIRDISDTPDTIANTKEHKFKLFDNNSLYNIKGEYYNSSVGKDKFPYNYTYSLSFYIYINPQPDNTSIAYTKDTILFNYAYKPVVFYNGKSKNIIIKSRTMSNKGDQLDTIYELKNPKHQKWLFFVINYDNNIIDIFVDGKLVGSKKDVSPYFKGDKITIGEKNGIHGSIKEIYYYDKITTPSSIQLLYNLAINSSIDRDI